MKKSLILGALVALSAGAAHGQVRPGGVHTGAIGAACIYGVQFDGACRSRMWIKSNLADGRDLLDVGACEDGDHCDLHFTVLDVAIADTCTDTAAHTMSTYMVTDRACTTGDGCLEGYSLSARTTLNLAYDVEDETATGLMSLYVAPRTLMSGLARLSFAGQAEISANPNRSGYDAYDRDGERISGAYMTISHASSGPTCEAFPEQLLSGSDLTVGGAVRQALEESVEVVASDRRADISFGFRPQASDAEIARVSTSSLTEGIASQYADSSICDALDEACDGTDDVVIDYNDPDFGELERYGCYVCTEREAEEREFSTEDSDGNTVTLTVTGLEGCVEWEVDPNGTDEDWDGWCDD
ncbi:MAG: hypothetical protein ACE366_21055 [Bradymonadia bacterium]